MRLSKSCFLIATLCCTLLFAACTSQPTDGEEANKPNTTQPDTKPKESTTSPSTKPSNGPTTPKPAPQPKVDPPCTYNGHPLHVGPKGGCYYYYDGKKKEYVDRSFCSGCK